MEGCCYSPGPHNREHSLYFHSLWSAIRQRGLFRDAVAFDWSTSSRPRDGGGGNSGTTGDLLLRYAWRWPMEDNERRARLAADLLTYPSSCDRGPGPGALESKYHLRRHRR